MSWALRLLFYVCLDAVTGAIIYAISLDEADLLPGQLATRILTAMTLVSAIVGGPDIMLYWQESGRRIAAEQERDAMVQRFDELSAQVEQLRNNLAARRSRRRQLRSNAQ